MSRLFVLIPGFGIPYWDHKVEILRSNLKILKSYNWDKIIIVVAQYSLDKELPDDILHQVNVIKQPGKVGEFMIDYSNPTEEFCKNYDYILYLLDDIELQNNINWEKILKWKKELNINIISPTLTLDSVYVYPYMLTNPNSNLTLFIGPTCEMFCFLFDIESFKVYYSFIDRENPYIWGLDLIIGKHMKMRVGRLNTMTMKHYYQNKAAQNDRTPGSVIDQFINYLAKHNETHENLAKQKIATYYIVCAE